MSEDKKNRWEFMDYFLVGCFAFTIIIAGFVILSSLWPPHAPEIPIK